MMDEGGIPGDDHAVLDDHLWNQLQVANPIYVATIYQGDWTFHGIQDDCISKRANLQRAGAPH